MKLSLFNAGFRGSAASIDAVFWKGNRIGSDLSVFIMCSIKGKSGVDIENLALNQITQSNAATNENNSNSMHEDYIVHSICFLN